MGGSTIYVITSYVGHHVMCTFLFELATHLDGLMPSMMTSSLWWSKIQQQRLQIVLLQFVIFDFIPCSIFIKKSFFLNLISNVRKWLLIQLNKRNILCWTCVREISQSTLDFYLDPR
jgi:hypothetical protein